MVRRDDRRALRMEPSVAHAHLARGVHQFGDEKKAEHRRPKRLNAALGSHGHMRVLDGVLDAVLVEHLKSAKLIRKASAAMKLLPPHFHNRGYASSR
jgi:hypothetical protein